MVTDPIDLTHVQTALRSYLVQFLAGQTKAYQDYFWTSEVFPRLTEFATTGKLMRGSLVLTTAAISGLSDFTTALPLAAAVELMQSSLLIHDDIIDHDQMRRGKPSIFAQYQTLADERNYHGVRAGEGLAICVGDIGFFLAFQLLAKLECSDQVRQKLITVFGQEYLKVGLGEMHDVHLAMTPETTTEAEILEVYRIKTARYTITLPILLTAILVGLDQSLIEKLSEVSETIGLIFQLKDDELGLFGTEAEIGKPVISDVREGKKTLYYLWGLALAADEQRTQLQKLFGKSDLSLSELEQVKAIVIANGARQKVDDKILELQEKAEIQIQDFDSQAWQAFLKQILDMNLRRTK